MLRKIATFSMITLLVGIFAVPATAGVGGCRPFNPNCNSGGGFFATSIDSPTLQTANVEPVSAQQQGPTVLDQLGDILPVDVMIMLQVMFSAPSDTLATGPIVGSSDGVGGCFGRNFGVGGCKL